MRQGAESEMTENPRPDGCTSESSPNGRLERIPNQPVDLNPRQLVSTHYRWIPPQCLGRHLPVNFSIEFVHIDDGCQRRLMPAASTIEFTLQAAIVGMARMKARRQPAGVLATYRMMYFLFQLGPQLRERLDRRLNYLIDLYGDNRTRLYDHLLDGVGTSTAAGETWTVLNLLEHGCIAAEQAGIETPDFQTRLAYGIDRDAAQRPIELTPMSAAEAAQRLRIILFDTGPNPGGITEAVKERVYGRLVDALQSHLGEDSDNFRRWFFKNLDNIIHQISKRKKPDGPIDRELVRQVVLELTFQSFSCVGQLVSHCMETVRECIEPRLADSDQAVFDAVYGPSDHFGDIPLILLSEQFPALQPSVLAVLEQPGNPERWGRLLRAMQTYAGILLRLRQHDRKRKGGLVERQLDERNELRDRRREACSDWNDFEELLAHKWRAEGIQCLCSESPLWKLVRPESEPGAEPIEIQMICQVCRTPHYERYTLTQLRQMTAKSKFDT